MTRTPGKLVWLLVAIILAIAAWRISTLHQKRSRDQKKLTEKFNAH